MPNATQEGIYAQYYNSVIKMAQKEGGVSRPALMHALGISRTVADGLIGRCKLRHSRTDGKTEFFSISRGTKKVLNEVGGEADAKESTMTDTAPNPSDPKGLVASVVGDDQPAPPAKTSKKGGKNRLPKEDQQTAPPQGQQPEQPAQAASVAPTQAAPPTKTAVELDQEIVAIQTAMKEANAKSQSAYHVYLAQKAHADGLSERLAAVIAQRLNATA
jgi:hypothetical protein